jgi:hypothetical protein
MVLRNGVWDKYTFPPASCLVSAQLLEQSALGTVCLSMSLEISSLLHHAPVVVQASFVVH